ncbi:hypothetical protein [Rhodococcoides fascians]|uniref:hypothetical protein n=1 Tax=Rhodococcoides fascians TaxID=1828 RepID=UPI003525D415
MLSRDPVVGDPPGSVGVPRFCWQQFQRFGRLRGVELTNALLLVDDDPGGRLGDRQSPTWSIGFDVVVDQNRLAASIAFEAIEPELADLVRPPPSVHRQLDSNPDFREEHLVENMQVRAQMAHDFRWQIPPLRVESRRGGNILLVEDEIVRQSRHHFTRLRQSHRPHSAQNPANTRQHRDASTRAQDTICMLKSHSIHETGNVASRQQLGSHPSIAGALKTQTLGQLTHRADLHANAVLGMGRSTTARQVVVRPDLDRISEPRL